jgi:integrase
LEGFIKEAAFSCFCEGAELGDLVTEWLQNVAYSNSGSPNTQDEYIRTWKRFSNFIGKTAEQIEAEYNSVDKDRGFKRQYARLVRTWIAALSNGGLEDSSIKVMVGVIQSFFKYSDLPLGKIPQARSGVVYHNRDITAEEIVKIMAVVKLRERAFFAVMAQSGLRPHTVKQLRIKNLESLDTIPCKIEVPRAIAKGKYGGHITFIAADAAKYLKQYFETKKELSPESLVFSIGDYGKKPVNSKDVSRIFNKAARKLRKSGAIDFEVREGKPSEIRLYNLRKFFRKFANQMGFEHVEYMMGHTIKGSSMNYKPEDPEFYRQLYLEKAMPFLRLETLDPLETEKAILELKQKSERQIRELKQQLAKKDLEIEELNAKIAEVSPEKVQDIASKIFQKSFQSLVTKTLEISAEEFKKHIKKEKENVERPQSSEETTKSKGKAE